MTPTRPLPAFVRSFSWSIAAKLLSNDFTASPDGMVAVPPDDDEPPPHAARTTATAPAHAAPVSRLTLPTCTRIAAPHVNRSRLEGLTDGVRGPRRGRGPRRSARRRPTPRGATLPERANRTQGQGSTAVETAQPGGP